MPRIHDAYLDCVIYLYASVSDAEAGARTGGSGFIAGVPTTDLRRNVVLPYAVTNRHVLEGGNLAIRVVTKEGRTEAITTEPEHWRIHPDGDDLAVCLIHLDYRFYRYQFVHQRMFVTKEVIEKFKIGPGDETFVVGRFVNHEGRQRNLPSVRFGCIAQMPWEPVKHPSGFEQESFLVESRSLGGFSGSPVFVYIPMFSDREAENWYPPDELSKWNAQAQYGSLMSHGPWLLGVDWGHLNDWDYVRGPDGLPVDRSNQRIRLNTGMMGVVPAWKLAELLDSPEVVERRQPVIQQIRQQQN